MSTVLDTDKEMDVDLGDDIELEIVDDDAKPSGETAEERARGDADVEKFGGRAQKRYDELTYRAREAERQRDIAFDMAKKAREALARSEQAVVVSSDIITEDRVKAAENAMEAARAAYKTALEANDPDAMVAANEALSNATVELRAAQHNKVVHEGRKKEWEESQKGQPDPVEQLQRRPNSGQPQLSAVDIAWREKNADWWEKDEEMSSLALAVSGKLIREGETPGSESYYQKIDARMRQVFRDYKWDDQAPKREASTDRPGSSVAPPSRGGGNQGRKVKLSPSEVAVCRELGVDPKKYALEKHAMEANNG